MNFEWVISSEDENRYRHFLDQFKDHPFVRERVSRNIDRKGVEVSQSAFWKIFVGCLLTTQQRSGAGSRIEAFLASNDQLLAHEFCLRTDNLREVAEETLRRNRFRRSTLISKEIEHAAKWLNKGGWKTIEAELQSLLDQTTVEKERTVTRQLQTHLNGLGPKQSRNLIQWMGLSQYEVPLDSRMIKVLADLAFPVPLSATALADEKYYCFIEDGIQSIMSRISVKPCVFDACVFASRERNAQPSAPADGPRAARSARRTARR